MYWSLRGEWNEGKKKNGTPPKRCTTTPSQFYQILLGLSNPFHDFLRLHGRRKSHEQCSNRVFWGRRWIRSADIYNT